jgi:hypothetical protein
LFKIICRSGLNKAALKFESNSTNSVDTQVLKGIIAKQHPASKMPINLGVTQQQSAIAHEKEPPEVANTKHSCDLPAVCKQLGNRRYLELVTQQQVAYMGEAWSPD